MGEAIRTKDEAYIKKVAIDQFEAGADFIDVNAGIFVDEEPEYLRWLVEKVQEAVKAPCSIDSPSPKAIQTAMEVHQRDAAPMLNSISLEKERYDALVPIVAGTDMKIVALCMSDEGMPETTEQRLAIANGLDGLIINPLDKRMMANMIAAETLTGKDEFCMGYLKGHEPVDLSCN